MLTHPVFHEISIDTKKNKYFQYLCYQMVTIKPNYLTVYGSKNSQHSILIFHNENNASQKNDLRKIFQNCSQHLFKSSIDLVTDLYMEDIANIICHVY